MADTLVEHLPPLQGCLYCHSEGTTTLSDSRKILGFGNGFPLLRCSHCNSVAFFAYEEGHLDNWRIKYRRVNRASRYYYVSVYLGRAGWLSASKALEISTNGFVQRMRVAQAKSGDLTWLSHSSSQSQPSPACVNAEERVYLTLKAVTLQETPPPGILVRSQQGALLDSGKFYVTDQRLYLLGQRRDWFYTFDEISRIDYNDKYWTIYLDVPDQEQRLRGANVSDQLDAQLVAAVVESLLRNY